MEKIYVFWHKNPDTDTILSSIVYWNFLKSKWYDVDIVSLWNINNETKFLLEKFWLTAPKTIDSLPAWSKVVLVDHNEPAQSISNLSELEIVWVIDHHKFWNFSTNAPVYVKAEPLCSTCSVIYNIFRFEWYQPDQITASLMIAAILSDSLLYKSPTITDYDKKIVEELNRIACIPNIESFAMDMFNAKSDLWDIKVEDLIKLDYKEFDFNWTKAWIWVIETVNPAYAMWRKDEILKWLADLKSKSWLNLIYLSVVDILKENNQTFVLWDVEKDVLNKIYWAETIDNIADLWKVISRKKQVIPQFTQYFSK